jgi:hypothetical protein
MAQLPGQKTDEPAHDMILGAKETSKDIKDI